MLRRLGWLSFLGILILVVFPVDSRAAGKPNIVLITLDSTRADRMGFLGAHGGLTPSLDGIAHQGIAFAQAYAQAPATVPSHATILTGTYPQVNRASEFGAPLAPTLPYLPDLLHAAGYRTAAFVGSMLLDPRNGPFQQYDRGFDVYDAAFHQPVRGESRYQSVERRGDEVVVRATKWLAGNKQRPFFLWVHLHDPSVSSGASYDRAVAAADAATGKLIAFLHTQFLYDDAVIIVASAYGESLGAHGEDTHSIFLYDETIHVPLVVKLPKSQMAGRQIRNRARLLDIAPTLLETAGVPVPSQMQGQSLLRVAQASSQADQSAYSRSDLPQQAFQCSALESWRAGKYLYIRAPKPELYDLIADPNATRNLAQNSKATLETMAAQLQALDNYLGNGPGKATGGGLTSSEMQKLASLGYVGLQKSGAGVSAATEGTDPNDVIAAANKTIAALRDLDDGKPEKAIPVLRQVLTTQPNTYLAQYGMGAALIQQQQYAEAIAYLHKAIELQPESAWAHYAMGLSLMKTGDFKTSAVHLEIASERLPAFSALHSALAEAYEHLGRRDEAARQRTKVSLGESQKK
ncbi:MAG TPA: sulfatase-like hydrolase/transferase [Candidatus Sulfotelmatobacter sp.]|jgi:arylsulfatase A-like enzyme/Tfp pilus assembly protein PilF|nr:sulfatase-like hydrolase/transferase [Candidatus Sulfotelmatobacter sp.]